MTTQEAHQDRIRINTAISTKGQVTWDCTVELSGDIAGLAAEALKESDALVAQLTKRYPAPKA